MFAISFVIDILSIFNCRLLIACLFNWAIGIAFVQYFYHKTYKLRTLPESYKQKVLPFTNSPELWNRLIHILLSFFMVPRLIGFLGATIICCIAVWFIMLGAGPKVSHTRHILIKWFAKVLGRVGLFCGSYLWITHTHDEVDYSKWLGKDYKEKMPNKRPPVIVSNHRTWSDVLVMMTMDEFPSYVASSHIRDLPLYGFLAVAFGSFFVQRGDKNSRDSTVFFLIFIKKLSQIKDRVNEIVGDEKVPQLAIFPEGGTSNGKYLLRFKRGAFEALEPIQPIYFEYYSPYCNPACEVIPIHLNLLFMACQPFTMLTVHKMPVIYPTEFMYKNARYNERLAKPEIYADTMREIFSETYNLEMVNNSHIEKVQLKEYLYGNGKNNIQKID